jgi:ferric-dicitrate binding protein FerR (iron transport regulator)
MANLKMYSLLHKKATGQLNPAELAELKQLENEANFADISKDVEQIWIASKDYYPKKSFDVSAAKAKFKKNIAAEAPKVAEKATPIKENKPVITDSSSSKWIIGAVGLLLLAALSYFLWPKNTDGLQQVETVQAENNIEYAKLDDNTEVWLQEGTILKVGDFNADGTRKVSIEGEAFFDVTHNPDKPFIVGMGDGKFAEVMGTSFNIISDLGDETSQVDVKTGTVKVYNENDPKVSTILTAGESTTINASSKTLEKTSDSEIYTLLGTSLSFKEKSLDHIFDKFSEKYNVEIDYSEAQCLNNKHTSPLIDGYTFDEAVESVLASYPKLTTVPAKIGDQKILYISGTACQ